LNSATRASTLKGHVPRQPDFVIHPRLFEHHACAFVDARQHPSERNRVEHFNIHLGQLQVAFVDPHPPANLRKKLRFFHVRLEPRPRFAINHPGVASAHLFRADQLEVIGVGDFAHELSPILAFFRLFFFALAPIFVGFVLTLVDDLLDLLFFLRGFLGVQRLVIFLDEPLHLFAVNLQNLVGLHFRRLGLPLAVEIMLHFAIDVGVVALPLVVLDVFIGDHAQQLPHLFLRELAVGPGSQIGDSSLRRVRCGRRLILRSCGGSCGGRRLLLSEPRQADQQQYDEGKSARLHDVNLTP
jgi:hypothetical protein